MVHVSRALNVERVLKMEVIFFFLLSSVFLNTGLAWPTSLSARHQHMGVERALQESGAKYGSYRRKHAFGRVTDLCTSVVADPAEASSPNASVHLCQQG